MKGWLSLFIFTHLDYFSIPLCLALSLLLGKPLRINVTRRNFKSFFLLLFDYIRTKSFCLLIYNCFICFRDHLCNTCESSVLPSYKSTKRVSMFTCTFHSKFEVTLASVHALMYASEGVYICDCVWVGSIHTLLCKTDIFMWEKSNKSFIHFRDLLWKCVYDEISEQISLFLHIEPLSAILCNLADTSSTDSAVRVLKY